MLLNRGFTLRRSGLSSDTIASLLIGATSTIWSAAVLRDVLVVHKVHWLSLAFAAELTRGPLLIQTLFVFWIVSYVDGLRAEKMQNAKCHFWSLVRLRGPYDWESGVSRLFYWSLITSICTVVTIPSLAALFTGRTVNGSLGLAGLLLLLFDGVGPNPYVSAQHRYADDRLRIALPTSHHEGTVYVLPTFGRGFDAVWSPKIAHEFTAADKEIMVLFQHMRSSRWSASEPLERLRRTLVTFHEKVVLSGDQLELLAAWIYCLPRPSEPNLRKIKCQRARGVHLIGRDLIYALCHAEYLVFMAQGRISDEAKSRLGTLRLMSRSGSGDGGTTQAIGFEGGYAGYRHAVEHVYEMFDLEVEQSAIEFADVEPPKYSSALSRSPTDIHDYVSGLWDMSCQHTESTFSALHFFTTVWFMELGNVGGFHIFPLRCQDREGDLVGQQLAWRQAWYAGVTAQLITVSPLLFGFFVTGILQ